ncbi:MAG: spondin domain-containing protein [Actinobacteria bacterium]|nr:spondin domain-containing protein [Actinomycetota bacterium]
MRRSLALLCVAALSISVAALTAPTAAAGTKAHAYRVTITNLTTGQPMTPPVVALTRKNLDIFTVGKAAMFELQQIAENGDNAPLVDFLDGRRNVSDFAEGTAPLVPTGSPGDAMFDQSVTFTLDRDSAGARYLSFAAMLICTNDGFSGLDRLRLPERAGLTKTVHTLGYDSGTEANTEDFGDIVPPCQPLIGVTGSLPGTATSDPALVTNDVIHHHSGITGRRDLRVDAHGWDTEAPVMEVTIESL